MQWLQKVHGRENFQTKQLCKRKNQEKKIKECTDNVNVK